MKLIKKISSLILLTYSIASYAQFGPNVTNFCPDPTTVKNLTTDVITLPSGIKMALKLVIPLSEIPSLKFNFISKNGPAGIECVYSFEVRLVTFPLLSCRIASSRDTFLTTDIGVGFTCS